MLSIGKIAASPQAAKYYTDQVAQGREDYYAGEGEAPGGWTGAGSASIGLSGEVEPGKFAEMLAGGGLRQPVREGTVAGFDLTFRAPKSVSVLWGIADAEVARQLSEAHDAAVADALGYIERNACWGRRGAGGVIQVRGGGLVAAAFRHRASRAGDPLLHTHVVAGNLTRGPDGRWTALDARHLYRHAKTAGYLYQAVLRREITERLGLEWGAVEHGVADLKVVPREVIDHFSRRRAEILEHMADHGGRSATSAQVAALETRRAKQTVNADRLREQWRARAIEHGLSPAIDRSAADHAVPLVLPVTSDELTSDKSVFGRAELLQALAAAQPRGATVAELEQLAEQTLADVEVVGLPAGPVPAGLTERRFSTRDMLAIERALLDAAASATASGTAVVGDAALIDALSARSLSAEQRQVVVELCGRGDGVSVLRAAAGTGKTFALDAARAAWETGGFEVLGCALSARAALELSDQAGIPSVTIARLTRELAERPVLGQRSVLIVDEAGMVGTRDLARLAAVAREAGAKLVLVGDDRQLPEIQAGGAFRGLAERLPTSELHEVRRQREAWDRRALDALRSGDVELWARAYREHGRITVGDSAGAARAALVNDWARADGDRLMIAARRDDVTDLNRRARELLQARGEIAADALSVGARDFAVGERIIGTRNDRRAGILNGQRGTITAIDPASGAVEVQLDTGRQVRPSGEYIDAGHLDYGYAITAHRAQGATVDRTFVLGSEELYREWGYTALSRHRDQSRFYVARGDLRIEPELPLPTDPVVDAVSRLMQRSQAKELAVDALAGAARGELEDEQGELRRQLSEGLPRRRIDDVAEKVRTARADVERARETERDLVEQRSGLGWRDRSGRGAIDARLERCRQEIEWAETKLDSWTRAGEMTAVEERTWVAANVPAAARLVAVDRELLKRDDAARRVAAVGCDPLPDRRQQPSFERDLEL